MNEKFLIKENSYLNIQKNESNGNVSINITVEPVIKFKDGDILVREYNDRHKYIFIFKEIGNNNYIYYHCYYSPTFNTKKYESDYGVGDINDILIGNVRYATLDELDLFFKQLQKDGKSWNADKKCIEDIPKYKFKPGDKVRIKDGISSQTHHNIYPYFDEYYNKFIGKIFTVTDYVSKYFKYVGVNETICTFPEDWLELVSDDLKIGDWVIAWDIVGEEVIAKLENIYGSDHKYLVAHTWYQNAVKWNGTKEQLEKLRGKKL